MCQNGWSFAGKFFVFPTLRTSGLLTKTPVWYQTLYTFALNLLVVRDNYVWDNFTSDFSVFDLLELIVRKHAFTLTVIQSQTNSNWCYDSGTAVKLTIETRLLTIFRQNRQVDGFVKFLFLSIHLGLLNRFMWLVSVLFIKCPSILHFLVRSTFDQGNQPNNRRGCSWGLYLVFDIGWIMDWFDRW